MTSRAGLSESTDAIDVYKNWSALAGYFDGDGTIEFNPHKYTIEIRLAFDENWKPHLDGIRSFLEERGYCCGKVRKKERFTTWHLVISRKESVDRLAKQLARHTVKKRNELLLVLAYFDGKITAEMFVEGMNQFVRMGERTGKVRPSAPPYTLAIGRELARICLTKVQALRGG